MKDRRIAILLPSLKFGGSERVALTVARALKQIGMDVEFLLMSRQGEFLAEAEAEFNVVDLRCDRTRKLPHRLVEHLSAHQTDILLCSFWKLNLCAAIARFFVPNVQLLLWEHAEPSLSSNSPKLLYAVTASLLYRQAARVICVSGGVYDDVARWTFGLQGRLSVIHNPIPPPPASIASHRQSPEHKLIAWVGRLDDPKNPGLLLDALALVAPESDVQIVFIGDGPYRDKLQQRSVELGLQPRVRFAGFQANPYEILATCDLLVLTSDQEGLGNVLIEAMHCGLGVVSTDCGKGIHEILADSKYGTIVAKRDPRALAAAIRSELAQPRDPTLQKLGAMRFLPEVIASEFLEVIV